MICGVGKRSDGGKRIAGDGSSQIAGDGSSQIAGVAVKEKEIGESLEREAEMTKKEMSRVFIFNDSDGHVSVGISSESFNIYVRENFYAVSFFRVI